MGTNKATVDSQPETTRSGGTRSEVMAVANHEERAVIAELPTRPLHELDILMALRVLHIEVALEEGTLEDEALLDGARTLRTLLLRASGHAGSDCADSASFEALVGQAIRRMYAWAFRALDAATYGQPVRSLPRAAEQLLGEVVNACEARIGFDPLLTELRDTLLGVGAMAARMSAGRGDPGRGPNDAP